MQIKFASPSAEEEWIGEVWTVRTTARILLRPRSEMWPQKGEKESCVSHKHLTRGPSCPEANVEKRGHKWSTQEISRWDGLWTTRG